MIGILLLDGNAGLSSGGRAGALAAVSVRLKLANFEGGSGLEPDGRANLLERRSSR